MSTKTIAAPYGAEPLVVPGSLPAPEVEERLLAAIRDLDTARRNAVIWFGEILERKLHRELGCSSIYHYASTQLGFSRARTTYFLRLCRSFERLPALRDSVASGAVPWTKARVVVKVATPQTEAFWVEQAQATGRRELERRVAATRSLAQARRKAPGQGDLLVAGSGIAAGASGDGVGPASGEVGAAPATGFATGGSGSTGDACPPPGDKGTATQRNGCPPAGEPVVEVPVTVSFTLTPAQYARYEALFERARKVGHRESREELFLAAWEMLTRVEPTEDLCRVETPGMLTRVPPPAERVARRPPSDGPRSGGPVGEDDGRARGGQASGQMITRGNIGAEPPAGPVSRGASAPRYQIVIRQCETCGRAEIATGRGNLPISPATLEAALCDARIHRPGQRNLATIPPSVRREVLARDGHRCRTAGCGSTRFLDVHHVVPREHGGSNDPDCLITLCAACHRMIHERAAASSAWPTRDSGSP